MFPLALGTQTGGSVIRPGSYCGIHALKPTLGLVSRTGVTLQSHTLDTVGVYGRSLGDLAMIADALSQYDPSDAVSYERARPGMSAVLAEGMVARQRLGFFRSPAWASATPGAKAALEAFVKRLGEVVETVEIPALDGIIGSHSAIMEGENAGYYGPWHDKTPAGFSPMMAERLEAAKKLPAGIYVQALAARERYYAEVERVLSKVGALITLSSPGSAPIGHSSTGDPVFNGMWTYLGVPCVSLPLMTVDGLPCGVQLIGKRRDEGRLLAIARWVEQQAAEGQVMR